MPPPPPPPLSPVRRAGDLLFVSGQLPRDSDGDIVRGDIGSQADLCLDNLATVLAREGASLGDVVKTTVWLTDAAHLAGFNAAYRARFSAPMPARSTVISGLVAPADIEIEAVAFHPPAWND